MVESKTTKGRRLVYGKDGQGMCWLYPDGSHRCITEGDAMEIQQLIDEATDHD